MPDVTYSKDGRLHVEGNSNDEIFASIENMETGESRIIELTEQGADFNENIQLEQKGMYHISIGGKMNTTIMYQ